MTFHEAETSEWLYARFIGDANSIILSQMM